MEEGFENEGVECGYSQDEAHEAEEVHESLDKYGEDSGYAERHDADQMHYQRDGRKGEGAESAVQASAEPPNR